MPKEKATRKTKSKVADAGGKKKKGMWLKSSAILFTADLDVIQTPTRPSVAFLPTCSLPTSSVRVCVRRTQGSLLVCDTMSCMSASVNPASHALGQVGKVLGEKWKGLSGKEREPYEAKAKEDKERYESEKASYNVRATDCLTIDEWSKLTLFLALGER